MLGVVPGFGASELVQLNHASLLFDPQQLKVFNSIPKTTYFSAEAQKGSPGRTSGQTSLLTQRQRKHFRELVLKNGLPQLPGGKKSRKSSFHPTYYPIMTLGVRRLALIADPACGPLAQLRNHLGAASRKPLQGHVFTISEVCRFRTVLWFLVMLMDTQALDANSGATTATFNSRPKKWGRIQLRGI